MKTLKTTLFLTYAVLIALLLLSNLKSCKSDAEAESTRSENTDESVSEDFIPDEELIDDAISVGESGNLKVTLLWDFYADIDLHVTQPNGEEINFQNKEDAATGGQLDIDDRTGGNGAAENIYWEHPPHGEYEVYLHYYSALDDYEEPSAGTCHVIVFIKGQEPRTFNVRMSEPNEMKRIVRFTI